MYAIQPIQTLNVFYDCYLEHTHDIRRVVPKAGIAGREK